MLLLITGLPGTGKTTLASALGARLSWPVFSKDAVKQPLLDALGPGTPARSRALSDASFAAVFAFAAARLEAGPLILEGNFRAGEHEPALATLLGLAPRQEGAAPCAQILCRMDPDARRAHVTARAAAAPPASVHAGLAAQLGPVEEEHTAGSAPADRFLDLPGPKRLLAVTSSMAAGAELDAIERWVAACM